ncbi:MAG: hypothetical protein K1X75_10785 [Leptospirales bacterium]|nr:hypothetical protein [Leptospirales bacterium]
MSERRNRGLRYALRLPAIRLGLLFVVCYFALDALAFRFLLWRIPDESAWGDQPHFHFEYALRRLQASPRGDGVRILVLGSSLALYSVQPLQLQSALNNERELQGAEVQVLAHQGMTPMHLNAMLDRILDLKPDLAILPTNSVDYHLEYPILHEDLAELDAGGDRRDQALARMAEDVLQAREIRELAPFGLARIYCAPAGLQVCSAALMSTLSAGYRYRFPAREALWALMENRFSAGRSYLNYAGAEIGEDGVTERGWTGRRFSAPLAQREISAGLRLEAPVELFLHGSPELSLSLVREGRTILVWSVSLQQGWNTLRLPDAAKAGDLLTGQLDRGWHSAQCSCELGLRLTRNAGLDTPRLRPEERVARREDRLYLSLNDTDYRASFEERLMRFDRAGMQYLHSLKIAKDVWASRDFDSGLPTARAFQELRQRLLSAGVRVLIINSPENPISLSWYRPSRWYSGWLEFLRCPSGSGDRCRLFDAASGMPMQLFYDHHHLSYYGARQFTEQLAAVLKRWPIAVATGAVRRDAAARQSP